MQTFESCVIWLFALFDLKRVDVYVIPKGVNNKTLQPKEIGLEAVKATNRRVAYSSRYAYSRG
jgi:hypothetical protein